MLIENKFFFISLPRCASTSFMGSCMEHGLEIKHVHEEYDIDNQLKKMNKKNGINFNYFQQEFAHIHESVKDLKLKFGNQYDVISIKRDEHERFISLWKHILHEMFLKEHPDIYDICKNLSLENILFYKSSDLEDNDKIIITINEFITKNKLEKISEYGKNMIDILIRPYSYYHMHDPDIIWFDFNDLSKLENWVSNKLNMNFKLLKINSSKHFDCELKLNDSFKKKYDSIYAIYDLVKTKKTLL